MTDHGDIDTGRHEKPTHTVALLAVLEQKIRAAEARIKSLEACSDEHAGRLVALETGHKTLAEAVAEVRSELKALREDAEAIKAELVRMNAAQKNTTDRVVLMERRLGGWGALLIVLVEYVPSVGKAFKAWAFGG